ncbi:MAG: nicotinate phosphoribosyltransferase, partial [Wohlfahrtiimonas sp.]
DKLAGVRIDTSGNMVDQYFMRNPEILGQFDPRGCNKELVFALRKALDDEGYQHVNIIVSGGLTPEKISAFEKYNVPIDVYGVGASLIEINVGFTGDNVLLDGKPQAKAGRAYWPNPKLEKVIYEG